MPRVVHFEIPADEPERALKFYADVFGWKAQKWEGPEDYWLIITGHKDQPGIDGGLMRRQDPLASISNAIYVPSVEDFVTKVTGNGGEVVLPKITVPGVGYLAYCKDTEGNIFSLFQSDEAAS